MTARAKVLVVDDERDMAESCAFFLARAGHESALAASGEEALARLQESSFDLVVTDLRMPRMSGLTLLETVRRRDPDIEVLLITGFPEIETAVAAIKAGAFDYVTKPFTAEAFLERVEKALAHRRMRTANVELRDRLRKGAGGRRLVYRSQVFGAMVATLERAARSDASVLIFGESGTGKELLAHHLHDASPRAGRPFVPVDCATIPENLVESELFGHVKGAFSGADQNRPGLIPVADGGTLFLDEVGELPLSFQPKLLRAIQERQVRRVGATDLLAVDVRIVSASNRDLPAMVESGEFRGDLFYRLDVVRIRVPPLRERSEDIEPLILHFLEELRSKQPHPIHELAPDARAALLGYDWPGNVRQLRNAIERAVALAHGPVLALADLPVEVRDGGRGVATSAAAAGTFQEMKQREIAALERSYLEGLLRKHAGNVTHCAEEAGMARSAFQKVMQRYGMKSSDYREKRMG